jgi:hypothetical protein
MQVAPLLPPTIRIISGNPEPAPLIPLTPVPAPALAVPP